MRSWPCAVVSVFLLGCAIPLCAQANRPQNRSNHTQFDEHDRQVTNDWYGQHQATPPRGLRPQDRLSANEERRLQPGQRLDTNMRRREHPIPSDLARRLPPPAAHHRYVAIGGHVGLVDQVTHVLNDVIHLHDRQ